MLESWSASILESSLTFSGVMLCLGVSLLLGIGIAAVYMVKNRYNKGFVVTLALLPAIVQVVIMLVNGNIGAGVAVAGAFSLVRFRSVPGSARDIGSIFFAMAIGLATGMGYLFYAFVFFVLIGLMNIVLFSSKFGQEKAAMHVLRVTIPENLDYEGIFDDLFAQYAAETELDRVRTTNMGSLIELSYTIRLKTPGMPKEFLDALRCRNGNLNIVYRRAGMEKEEL